MAWRTAEEARRKKKQGEEEEQEQETRQIYKPGVERQKRQAAAEAVNASRREQAAKLGVGYLPGDVRVPGSPTQQEAGFTGDFRHDAMLADRRAQQRSAWDVAGVTQRIGQTVNNGLGMMGLGQAPNSERDYMEMRRFYELMDAAGRDSGNTDLIDRARQGYGSYTARLDDIERQRGQQLANAGGIDKVDAYYRMYRNAISAGDTERAEYARSIINSQADSYNDELRFRRAPAATDTEGRANDWQERYKRGQEGYVVGMMSGNQELVDRSKQYMEWANSNYGKAYGELLTETQGPAAGYAYKYNLQELTQQMDAAWAKVEAARSAYDAAAEKANARAGEADYEWNANPRDDPTFAKEQEALAALRAAEADYEVWKQAIALEKGDEFAELEERIPKAAVKTNRTPEGSAVRGQILKGQAAFRRHEEEAVRKTYGDENPGNPDLGYDPNSDYYKSEYEKAATGYAWDTDNAALFNLGRLRENGYSDALKQNEMGWGMTEDQKQTFYYLYAEDPEKAEEFAEACKRIAEDAYYAEMAEAETNPAARLWKEFKAANMKLIGGAIPFTRAGQKLTKEGTALAESVGAGREKYGVLNTGFLSGKLDEDIPFVGGKSLNDWTQLKSSMIMSGETAAAAKVAMATGHPEAAAIIEIAGLYMQSGAAANDDYIEMKRNGWSDNAALTHALFAGVAEATFEKVSLESLVNQNISRGFVRNLLTQGGIEASEEVATTIANHITDAAIARVNGYDNDRERRAKEYMGQGMSYNEAYNKADVDIMADLLDDALGGFLSGGLMSGGDYAVHGARTAVGKVTTGIRNTRSIYTGENLLGMGEDVNLHQKASEGAVNQVQNDSTGGSTKAMQAYAEANKISVKSKGSTRAVRANVEAVTDSIADKMYSKSENVDGRMAGAVEVYEQTVSEYGEGIKPVAKAALRNTVNKIVTETGDRGNVSATTAFQEQVGKIENSEARDVAQEALDYAVYRKTTNATQRSEVMEGFRHLDESSVVSEMRAQRNKARGDMTMQATVTDENGQSKAVDITGITEDGKAVELSDGVKIDVKDLQADADTKDAIQMIASMELGTNADKVLQAYRDSGLSGTEGYRFIADYTQAIEQGRTNRVSLERATKSSSLDAKTVMEAYTIGQQIAHAETQKALDRLKNAPKKKGATGRTATIDTSAIEGVTMSQSEREQFELANRIFSALGVDLRWVASSERNGRFVGANGSYLNGAVTLDIHAGRNFLNDIRSGILATTGHELTHFLEQYAPTQYKALKEFVFQQIVQIGKYGEETLERLIQEKKRRAKGRISQREAENEVVADACQNMLLDSKAVSRFAQEHEDAAKGIVRWLDKWFGKLRSAFTGSRLSEEARMMANLEKDVKQAFGDLWDKALEEAVEVHDRVGNIEKPQQQQNSDRDTEYLEAVENDDMATAQKMVRAAAKKAGYNSPKLYHGSSAFGFTSFNMEKSFGQIFATTSIKTAKTYSGETKLMRLSDQVKLDVDALHGDALLEAANKYLDNRYDKFKLLTDTEKKAGLQKAQNNITKLAQKAAEFRQKRADRFDAELSGIYEKMTDALNRIASAQTEDDYEAAYKQYDDALWDFKWKDGNLFSQYIWDVPSKDVLNAYRDGSDFLYQGDLYRYTDTDGKWAAYLGNGLVFDNQMALELDAELHKGVYQLYGRMGKKLTIDANGANWNAIVTPEELHLDRPSKTRTIAEKAFALGYDSVEIKNVRDNSDGTDWRGISDVYIFNAKNAVKSADPVTYDDSGNVIPLSERFNTENQDIRYSQREQYEEAVEASDVLTRYSLREEPAPQKTIKAYKAFYVKDGKLYPPMVSNNTNEEDKQTVKKASSGTMKGLETPVGVWLDADVGGIAVDENGVPLRTKTTGRMQVQNDKGGGTLAFRPGWHLGEWPDASQFNVKDPVTGALKSVMPDNLVFAECEIAADVDYQLEAYEYGISDKGGFSRTQAGLPRVPTNGYYKYRTNVDPTTAPWYITGAMKVTRILSDEERRQICNQFGVTPQERASHKDIDLEAYGLKAGPVKQTENLERFRKNKASYDNDALLKAALEDENYSNAYVRRTLDFDNETLAKEFELDRISPDQVKKYRESYQSPEVMRSERESAAKANVSLDFQSESSAPSDGTLFSERTWTASRFVQDKANAANALAKALGVSERTAKKYINNINSVAKLIADDRVRLDYESAPGLSSFKSNAEYGGSIDFSTLCKKRRLMTGTFSAIQNALPNTVLTEDDVLLIRKMMKDAGLEVSCGLCYVEGSRTKMGEHNAVFLERYKQYYPKSWQPTMADVTTPDGIEKMRINHPEAYEKFEYFYNHYGKLKPSDKAIFASQQKPKMYQLRTEYNGEILQEFKTDQGVETKNRNGGLRLQSFSDFEIVHLIDCMQVIADMSEVGLAGQAYTKVPEFAEALGKTGLKINLSLITKSLDADGKLVFDDVEGMPHERAFDIRKKYSKNVGTILVVYDDAQLLAAMADPRIDFIIPFHISQWKKSQFEAMGLPPTAADYNYQLQQNEKWLDPEAHAKKATNYMPNEYWDFSLSGKQNAEKYLEMCAKDGKRPKFYKLLQNNGDGSFSLKDDGSTDGYWKLLIDFKMYDNKGRGAPQQAVKPLFDMKNVNQMLEEYQGGHAKFPVAQGIVDEFVNQYKAEHPGRQYSMRDYDIPSDMELLEGIDESELKGDEKAQVREAKQEQQKIRNLERQLARVRNELKGLEGDNPSRLSVKDFTRNVLDLFGIPTGAREDVGEMLQSIAQSVLSGQQLSREDAAGFFSYFLSQGKGRTVTDESLAQIRDELKGRKIYVNQETRADFGDDWNAFRRRAFGLGIQLTSNENNMGVDSVNAELAEMFPGSFDAGATDMRSMLENMVDTAESGKSSDVSILDAMEETAKQTGEPVQAQLQAMMDSFLRHLDIMQDRARIEAKARAGNAQELAKSKNRAAKAAAELSKARKERNDWKRKATGAEARQVKAVDRALRGVIQHDAKQLAEAVRQKQALAKKLEMQLQREEDILAGKLTPPAMQRMLKAAKEAQYKKDQEAKEAQFAGYKDRKNRTAIRNRIKNLADDMKRTMTNPTDRKYVPASLYGSMTKLADALDDFLAPNDGTKAAERYRAVMDKIHRLSAEYQAVQNFDDPTYSSEYDEEIQEAISDIERILERKDASWIDQLTGDTQKGLRELETGELQRIYELMRQINYAMVGATAMLGHTQFKDVYAAMRSVADQQNGMKALNSLNRMDRWNRTRLLNNLSVMRAAEMMSDWDRGAALYQLMHGIEQGADDSWTWVMDYNKAMEPLKTGKNEKEYRQALTKQLDFGITDKEGQKVTMTKLQALQILMTAEREAHNNKLLHLQTGGAVIRNATDLQNGKGAKARSQTIEVTPKMLQQIQNGLTAWDRSYMKTIRDYFQREGKRTNEILYKLKHKVLQTEEFYIPYNVDKNYLETNLNEQQAMSMWVKQPGSTNALKANAKQPVIIDGMDTVMARHVKEIGDYVGMAIPIRDFSKVYNGLIPTGEDNPLPVKETIDRTFGKEGQHLLTQAVIDVQGGTAKQNWSSGISEMLNKLHGSFVKSALLINPSVTIKQAASYIAAESVVSHRALVLGNRATFSSDASKSPALIAYLFANPEGKTARRIYNEIDQHTSLHYQRRLGMSQAEIAEQANRNGPIKRRMNAIGANMEQSKFGHAVRRAGENLNPVTWIQRMDVATTATLWVACKEQAKLDGMKAGTAEFWQHTTELYERCLRETQPMYDGLHRTANQKQAGGLMQYLFPFRTVPIQNHGQLAASYEALKASKNKSKAEQAAARKFFAKTVWAQTESAFVFSMMTFLAAALKRKTKKYRDEDEEFTAGSFAKGLLTDVGSTLFSVLQPMYGSELVSLMSRAADKFEGNGGYTYDSFSVGVVDMLNDLASSGDKLVADAGKLIRGEDVSGSNFWNHSAALLLKGAKLAGIPADTVKTYIAGAKGNVQDIIEGRIPALNDESWDRATGVNAKRFFEAWEAGDEAKMQTVLNEVQRSGKSEDSIASAFNKAAKDAYENNGLSLEQYADYLDKTGMFDAEKISGKIKNLVRDEYQAGERSEDEAISALTGICGMDEDAAWKTVQRWEAGAEHVGEEDYSYSQYEDLRDALDAGKSLEEAGKEYLDHGYTEEQIAAQAVSWLKDQVTAGKINEDRAIQLLRQYKGMDADKAWKKVQEWKAKAEHAGDEDYSWSQYDEIDAAIDGNKDIKALVKELTDHGTKEKDVTSHVKSYLIQRYEDKAITESQFRNQLSRYCGIVAKKDVDEIVNNANCFRDSGFHYSELKTAYNAKELTGDKARQMLTKYGGMSAAEAKAKTRYWDFEVKYPDANLSIEKVNAYYDTRPANYGKTMEQAGISVQSYISYCQQASKATGTDKDGDGRTDSGSKKAAIMQIIDKLNITTAQKDALYYFNGWSAKTIKEAPWH